MTTQTMLDQHHEKLWAIARRAAQRAGTEVFDISEYWTDSTNPLYPRHGATYQRAVVHFTNGNWIHVWHDGRYWKYQDRTWQYYNNRIPKSRKEI